MLNNTISVSVVANDGILAPVWTTFPEDKYPPSHPRLAYDGAWGAEGAAFAAALITLDPFAYGAYYGDVGEDNTSDLVSLQQVDNLLSWEETIAAWG